MPRSRRGWRTDDHCQAPVHEHGTTCRFRCISSTIAVDVSNDSLTRLRLWICINALSFAYHIKLVNNPSIKNYQHTDYQNVIHYRIQMYWCIKRYKPILITKKYFLASTNVLWIRHCRDRNRIQRANDVTRSTGQWTLCPPSWKYDVISDILLRQSIRIWRTSL